MIEYYVTSVVAPVIHVSAAEGSISGDIAKAIAGSFAKTIAGSDEDTSDVDAVCWDICQCFSKVSLNFASWIL